MGSHRGLSLTSSPSRQPLLIGPYQTSTGIHLEFRHAHKALRPILACSSESVTADKLKSFSLRRLLAQLALLLPLSIQMLCAISNTSTDDPLDARGCRALGKKGRAREPPVASSALSAAVLGDAETEDNLVDPEEGTMGYNPCYVVEDGVVLNPWVPPEPGESGPLPLRLGVRLDFFPSDFGADAWLASSTHRLSRWCF